LFYPLDFIFEYLKTTKEKKKKKKKEKCCHPAFVSFEARE